jgi:hypothetical protein
VVECEIVFGYVAVFEVWMVEGEERINRGAVVVHDWERMDCAQSHCAMDCK